MQDISASVKSILEELPNDIRLVAAAKTRTTDEILESIGAGVEIIGHNYVQEAQDTYPGIGSRARWHFIGHLQKNKVKKAVELFDLIETVDSLSLAKEIDKRCGAIDKVMPVLIEVNSGREEQKNGVFPENVPELIQEMENLKNVEVVGIMTMGPFFGDPEDARPYFVRTKKLFDEISEKNIPGVQMKYLSMGMTNSYKVAVEEGANMIRIGTKIFGDR